MKINAIRLVDFTGYTVAAVEFEATVNFLIGANAAGKTSIVDGLTYALTGHCARTDKAGRGAESMIRTGAREAFIGVKFDGHTVVRKIPGGLAIDGNHGGQKELQDLLFEMLGADDGAITAALNTESFLDLPPGEQKSLLFGLLGLEADRTQIVSMIAAEAGDEAAEMVSQALGTFTGNFDHDLGVTYARLHKHFYDARRDAKRDLKDLGSQPPLVVEDLPDLQAVKDELDEKRTKLYRLEKAIDEYAARKADRAREVTTIAQLEKQLEHAVDTGKARKQLDQVVKEINALKLEAGKHDAEAKALRRAALALEEAGESRTCPLAPGVVTCPLGKEKRGKLISEIGAQAEVAAGKAEDARASSELLEPRKAELLIEVDQPDKRVLQQQLDNMRNLHAALPEKPQPEDTRQLAEEVRNLEGTLEQVIRAQGAREAAEAEAEKREALTSELEVLEVLVELCGPKGIPGRLLSETIGPLQDLANERLLQLTGGRYELRFEADPDFRIVVFHDNAEIDLKRLSSSERMRIGIILQDAISRLSGLRVMVIDNADILDPHNRMLLTETLLTIKDDYDSILVLSTALEATDPGIDDVAVYKIENGTIERVGEKVIA